MSTPGRDIHFAGSTIHLDWVGKEAESLVKFLFGDMVNEKRVCPVSEAPVCFNVIGADSEKLIQVTSNVGDNLRGRVQDVATYLVERVTYHIADRSSGGVLLHAACMSKKGEGLVLPGVSGRGKSTLAFWLEQKGYYFLTDELVYIPQGTAQCQGLARPINLKNVSIEMLRNLSPDRVMSEDRRDNQSFSRRFIRPQTIIPTTYLNVVVFPFYKKDANFLFKRLSGAETTLALTGSLVNARNLPDNGFPELLRLARSIPGYRLEYSNFDGVEEALNSISQIS